MCASCLEEIRREHYPEADFGLCGCTECEVLAAMLRELKAAIAERPETQIVIGMALVRRLRALIEEGRGGTH